MSTSRPITFDRVMRFLFAALVITGIIWLVDILRNVFVAFFFWHASFHIFCSRLSNSV